MISIATAVLASFTATPVPDSGASGLLLGLGILTLGLIARGLKNRKR